MVQIGELNEMPLHAALKSWYAEPGDEVEAEVDGYVVDIVKGDRLVEIQTGNFSGIKRKVRTLVESHPLHVVYPVAYKKWLYKYPKPNWDGPRRRKSPKQGRVEEVFRELVSFPDLLVMENFSVEVVMIEEEETRKFTGRKMWWRNGWEPVERRLLAVADRHVFHTPEDLAALLPAGLPGEFTTKDLAQGLESPRWLAQKMAYCLRKMGVISAVGRRGRAILYIRDGGAGDAG